MATLQIKNFPDELHAKLAQRAKDERTTMSEYATRILRKDLGELSASDWFDLVGHVLPVARRGRAGVDSADLVNRARDEDEAYVDAGIRQSSAPVESVA
jgi:hypothetical protein